MIEAVQLYGEFLKNISYKGWKNIYNIVKVRTQKEKVSIKLRKVNLLQSFHNEEYHSLISEYCVTILGINCERIF